MDYNTACAFAQNLMKQMGAPPEITANCDTVKAHVCSSSDLFNGPGDPYRAALCGGSGSISPIGGGGSLFGGITSTQLMIGVALFAAVLLLRK